MRTPIRGFIFNLSQVDFDSLRRSVTGAWDRDMFANGRPSRQSLNGFETELRRINSIIFDGYPDEQEYEILTHLFFGINERYLSDTR